MSYFKILLAKFKVLGWALKGLFLAAPKESIFLILFVTLQGSVPAAFLYTVQGIVHWLTEGNTFPSFLIILWGALLIGDTVLNPIMAIVRLQLNEKVLSYFNILLMEKSNTIQGLVQFENPKLYENIQLLKNEISRKPLNFVYVLTSFSKEIISLTGTLYVLGQSSLILPLSIFLVAIPHAISTLWFEKQSWDQMLFKSPQSRKMAWISSIGIDSILAKEVRLFGFGSFLIEEYKKLSKEPAVFKARWKKCINLILLSSLTVLGNVFIIGFLLFSTKKNPLNAGTIIITIQALLMVQTQIIGSISNLGMSYPIFLFFENFYSFLRNVRCSISNNDGIKIADFREIKFENVTFFYPDGRKILSNISFSVFKKDKIGIVGENGAGKSTIIKLLLRFYDPSEGTITVDGTDLKKLDLLSWRSLISGVFQDFGKYHFTALENIKLGDIKATQEKISIAAYKGGFYPVLDRLPYQLNSVLGKEFGGTDLSIGEWQKLAISRALVKEAKLLILDEPTSSLDPQSEYELFKKFTEQAEDKTVFLVTHRLGSIRLSDKILVFKDGKLIEEGNHYELLKLDREYSRLFKLQADLYTHGLLKTC